MKELLQQKLLNLILKPDITATQLEQIFQLPEINQNVIELILGSTDIPELVLDKVFEYPNLKLNWLYTIVLHKHTGTKLLENIFQFVENLDEFYYMRIVHCIAKHPNTSSNLLNKLLIKHPELDNNSRLLFYIANHANSNQETLKKILEKPGIPENVSILSAISENAIIKNFSYIIEQILEFLKKLESNNSLVTLEKIYILLIITPPAEFVMEILGAYKIQDLENYIFFQKLIKHYEITEKHKLIEQLWSMISSKSCEHHQSNLSLLPADIKAYILTFINSKYLLTRNDPNAIIFSNQFKLKNTESQLIIKANKMEQFANSYRKLLL